MNSRITLLFVVLLVGVVSVRAQDATADGKAVVDRVLTKLRAGQRTAAALAPELAAFDTLLEKYKDQKTEDVAEIAAMRASLYVEVLGDMTKGKELIAQVKQDYPGTKVAAAMDGMLSALEKREKAAEAKTGLVGKPAPQLNFLWASTPGLTTLSDLKGKVVVIDFWATWCGPCISSFPQVRQLVEHYKGSDVVVLGVTSIQGTVRNLEPAPIDTRGDPKKETSLMPAFMKAKDMTWAVAFSEEDVFNERYGVTGIPHMSIVAPDGTVRANGIHPASPLATKVEKIDAILKEFGLKTP